MHSHHLGTNLFKSVLVSFFISETIHPPDSCDIQTRGSHSTVSVQVCLWNSTLKWAALSRNHLKRTLNSGHHMTYRLCILWSQKKGKRGKIRKKQHLACRVCIHSSSVADISGYWQKVEHAVAHIGPEHPNMLGGWLAWWVCRHRDVFKFLYCHAARRGDAGGRPVSTIGLRISSHLSACIQIATWIIRSTCACCTSCLPIPHALWQFLCRDPLVLQISCCISCLGTYPCRWRSRGQRSWAADVVTCTPCETNWMYWHEWQFMVVKWTSNKWGAALVDIPAVSMTAAHSLLTCDICGIVLWDKAAQSLSEQSKAHLWTYGAV